MDEKSRTIIRALFWTVMAAAILALLLLPIPVPPPPPDFGIVKPVAPVTLNVTDLAHTPLSSNG
jgi:hypothetical protein